MAEIKPRMLLDGIDYDGKRHLEFLVKVPVMRDVYDALDETEEVCGSTESKGSDLYYRMALTKRILIQLGTISQDVITTDFLLDNLTSMDYDVIDDAIDDAKKAESREQRRDNFRTVVLALGQYGFTEQQCLSMSRPALDGYLNALNRLHGGKSTSTKSKMTRVKSRRQGQHKSKRG